MNTTTLTSHEFNRRTNNAKKATENGPVFITDQGACTHVLLSINDYRRLIDAQQKIADLLAMPSIDDLEFKIPLMVDLAESSDFS